MRAHAARAAIARWLMGACGRLEKARGWLVFIFLRSLPARTRRAHWHRRLGWFGAALGVAIPVLGTSSAITMGR